MNKYCEAQTHSRKDLVRKAAVLILALALIFFVCAVNFGFFNADVMFADKSVKDALSAEFSVHYIDCGYGNCVYLRYGDCDILIDCGTESSQKHILDYLDKCKVNDFEIVILTSLSEDCIGCLEAVAEKYDIGEMWFYDGFKSYAEPSYAFERAKRIIYKRNIKICEPSENDRLTYGELNIEFLTSPDKYTAKRDMSAAVKVSFKDSAFLFMGNASKRVEYDLLEAGTEVSADVIMLSNHAGSGASTVDFLKAVSPSAAVISVGDNSRGAPDNEVLLSLDEMGIEYYRTDLLSDIVIYPNGGILTIV